MDIIQYLIIDEFPVSTVYIHAFFFSALYTMEYSSAIRNDKYPPLASMWTEVEGIIVSEISQSKEDKHYMVSFIWRI